MLVQCPETLQNPPLLSNILSRRFFFVWFYVFARHQQTVGILPLLSLLNVLPNPLCLMATVGTSRMNTCLRVSGMKILGIGVFLTPLPPSSLPPAFICFFIYYVPGCVRGPWPARGDQRTNLEDSVFSWALWLPGPVLLVDTSVHWATLLAPHMAFLLLCIFLCGSFTERFFFFFIPV